MRIAEFKKWQENIVKKLTFTDIKLIKLSTASITLFIAKIWPRLLSLDKYVYLAIGLLAALPVWYKVFLKKEKPEVVEDEIIEEVGK